MSQPQPGPLGLEAQGEFPAPLRRPCVCAVPPSLPPPGARSPVEGPQSQPGTSGWTPGEQRPVSSPTCFSGQADPGTVHFLPSLCPAWERIQINVCVWCVSCALLPCLPLRREYFFTSCLLLILFHRRTFLRICFCP